MDAISAALISKALDGLSMRQSFLAQNIANAGSANYTQMNVTFEAELMQASKKGIESVENVKPAATAIPSVDGQDTELRIDMQLAESSKTALRYSALIEVMARQMGISRSAITGGQS